MKLRTLIFTTLSLGLLVFSCNDDDTTTTSVPDRNRGEVYAEDIIEIETFLTEYTYNYDEFALNNTYSNTSVVPATNIENDSFEIVFSKITDPMTQESLMDKLDNDPLVTEDVLKSRIVFDSAGQAYVLYYLVVREGLGDDLHTLDQAVTRYNGTSIGYNESNEIIEAASFDSSPVPVAFTLTSLGATPGVVQGFRDGLVKFKTSVAFTEGNNGDVIYHNHGIGAVFIPSGLGYFSQPLTSVAAYTPLIFKTDLINRIDTDYDLDNIPSHLEDLNGNDNGFDEDTDLDNLNNFFDNDDDNDGVLTINEDIEDTDLTFDSDGDGDPTNDKNGDGNPLNDDTDGDGIPNYLDADTVLSRD